RPPPVWRARLASITAPAPFGGRFPEPRLSTRRSLRRAVHGYRRGDRKCCRQGELRDRRGRGVTICEKCSKLRRNVREPRSPDGQKSLSLKILVQGTIFVCSERSSSWLLGRDRSHDARRATGIHGHRADHGSRDRRDSPRNGRVRGKRLCLAEARLERARRVRLSGYAGPGRGHRAGTERERALERVSRVGHGQRRVFSERGGVGKAGAGGRVLRNGPCFAGSAQRLLFASRIRDRHAHEHQRADHRQLRDREGHRAGESGPARTGGGNTMKVRAPSMRDGFTLVEVLVATVILAVGFLAMAATTGVVIGRVRAAGFETERAAAAQEVAERLRSMPFVRVESRYASDPTVVGGYRFWWASMPETRTSR